MPLSDVLAKLPASAFGGSRIEIAQLYVRVGFQRQRVGARLLAWAKWRSGASLWLSTFERNAGGRAFYERNGFVAIAHGFEPMWQVNDIK